MYQIALTLCECDHCSVELVWMHHSAQGRSIRRGAGRGTQCEAGRGALCGEWRAVEHGGVVRQGGGRLIAEGRGATYDRGRHSPARWGRARLCCRPASAPEGRRQRDEQPCLIHLHVPYLVAHWRSFSAGGREE